MFNRFDISGYSKSSNVAKNTDGWDTYRSTDITIMDSVINNGDGKHLGIFRSPAPLSPHPYCPSPLHTTPKQQRGRWLTLPPPPPR